MNRYNSSRIIYDSVLQFLYLSMIKPKYRKLDANDSKESTIRSDLVSYEIQPIPNNDTITQKDFPVHRGRVIIFNQFEFQHKDELLPKRHGSEKDKLTLVCAFDYLGFAVQFYDDKKKDEIFEILKNQKNVQKNECIVVVVMSHGRFSEIAAKDEFYKEKKMFMCLKKWKENQKLIVFQTCRPPKSKPRVFDFSIPSMNTIICYACYVEAESYRSETHGTIFIQMLCKRLIAMERPNCFLDEFSAVTRDVAFMADRYEKVQLPMLMHNLDMRNFIIGPLDREASFKTFYSLFFERDFNKYFARDGRSLNI